ncbi:uncharacterized protein METZ01_LOCUS230122, partial [marine metagenome]
DLTIENAFALSVGETLSTHGADLIFEGSVTTSSISTIDAGDGGMLEFQNGGTASGTINAENATFKIGSAYAVTGTLKTNSSTTWDLASNLDLSGGTLELGGTVVLDKVLTDNLTSFKLGEDTTVTRNQGFILGGLDLDNSTLTLGSATTDLTLDTTAPVLDTTAPVVAEVTKVSTPTYSTPNYTFSSSVAGTITYSGSCSSSTTSVIAGSNTITLNSLSDGTYSDCKITVTDSTGNVSNTHTITSFIVDSAATLFEVTPVTTPTSDNTVSYTFASAVAGTISYGGSCSSDNNMATADDNTITFDPLAEGTYSNCTITVTDPTGNVSNTLTISTFIVDTTAATLAEVTPVTTPSNDNTPNYTFFSTEAGTISYGGSCSSSNTLATAGNNIITINSLSDGSWSNCTIRVIDSAGNESAPLSMSGFTVDTTPPTLSSVNISSNNANTGDSIVLYIISSEPIQTPSVRIAGQAAQVTSNDGITWAAAYTMTN